MIECNPRASGGAFVTPESWLGPAIFDEPEDVQMVEAGQRRQYDLHLIDPHFNKMSVRQLLHELLTTQDAFLKPDDLLPELYFLIARRHFNTIAKKEHITMADAFLNDIAWDGTLLPDDRSSAAMNG